MYSEDQLKQLKVKELRELAKEQGIAQHYKLKKADLIEALRQAGEAPPQPDTNPYSETNLRKLKVKDLRQLGKDKQLRGMSTLKTKDELVAFLAMMLREQSVAQPSSSPRQKTPSPQLVNLAQEFVNQQLTESVKPYPWLSPLTLPRAAKGRRLDYSLTDRLTINRPEDTGLYALQHPQQKEGTSREEMHFDDMNDWVRQLVGEQWTVFTEPQSPAPSPAQPVQDIPKDHHLSEKVKLEEALAKMETLPTEKELLQQLPSMERVIRKSLGVPLQELFRA